MKPTTAAQLLIKRAEKNSTLIGAALHIMAGLCAFIFSHAVILDKMLPFGPAFVGGVKRKYLAISAAGCTIGYLTNLADGGFTYLAAVFGIVTVRIILGNNKFAITYTFRSLLTFCALGVTKLAVTTAYGGDLLLTLSESIIGGATAYFVAITFNLSPSDSSGTDLREMTSLTFFISVLLLSLSEFNIIGLSPGRIIAVSIILTSARYGRSAYGAVCGVIISFITLISNGEYISSSFIFAFSGLVCGVFSGLGALGMITAYISTTLLTALIISDVSALSTFFFEAIIGSGIFLIIPQRVSAYVGGLLSPTTEISRLDSVKGALIMRLEYASGALKDIYETVEDVASKLHKINFPDMDKTLNKIEEDVCGGCSLRKHCWETAREITAADALKTWNRLKSPQKFTKEAEEEFKCLRAPKFENSIKSHLADYENKRAAENRLKEVREVINDQFEGISKMLGDLSEEFKYEVRHDSAAAENIILSFKNMGFHAINCIAARDKFNRISADIHIKGTADKQLNKMELVRHLSLAVGRDLASPSVSVGGDEAFIFITERPRYKIEIGQTQIPEEAGKLCGDSLKYFADGRGRFIMLLSDGMGTGGRAAVDSAMVSGLFSRMLRSGFGYDCSLKIINSSMLFKSTDESLATVDICTIDLFSGECELLKAGAAPTFVKRSGKVGKAESNSLPPGILRNVTFDKAKLKLKAEDIVVMVSDGATTEETDWICDIIRDWTIGSAQNLADEIALAARRRRSDGHNDDISVMVAILKRN